MSRWFKVASIILGTTLIASIMLSTPAARAGTSDKTIRVGTFDKAAVTVAFYRSPMWANILRQKKLELEQANKINDIAKIEELNRWGSSSQEIAHRQLMGEAPLDNIMEALTPALPEIARRAGVTMIVPDLPYAISTVQQVDVTELLLVQLKADDQTRKIIRELPKVMSGHSPLQ